MPKVIFFFPASERALFEGRSGDTITFIPITMKEIVDIKSDYEAFRKLIGSVRPLFWSVLFTYETNSDLSLEIFDTLSRYLPVQGDPPMFITIRTETDEISNAIAHIFIDYYYKIAEKLTLDMKALNELRARHEQLQNDFLELEKFFIRLGLESLKKVFDCIPSISMSEKQRSTKSITQLLPLPLDQIDVVQIYLGSELDAKCFHSVNFKVIDLERNEIVGFKAMTTNELKRENVSIILERTDQLVHRTGMLIIEGNGAGIMPQFQITMPQLVEKYQLKSGIEDSISNGSLAFSLWTSISKNVVLPANFNLRDQSHTVIDNTAYLSKDLLRTIKNVPSEWLPGFNPVTFLAEEDAVECHPPPIGITAGIIQIPVISGTFSITTECYIKGTTSNPVDFCMAVWPTEEQETLDLNADNITDIFSRLKVSTGWITLIPGNRETLALVGEVQNSNFITIAIGTRMNNGLLNDSAWARYKNLKISYLSY